MEGEESRSPSFGLPAGGEGPMRLERESVHVWAVDLDGPGARHEAYARTLSPDELERAGRLRSPRLKTRFVAARGALRWLLSRYTGRDPAAHRFRYLEHGKPCLAGGGDALEFNVSHSDGLALVALARMPVGVDVERIARRRDLAAIAHRFFSPRENELLARAREDERLAAFYTFWTRKEAYLKACGLGISVSLERIDVSDPAAGVRALRENGHASGDAPADWSLADLDVGSGFRAALAAAGRPRSVRLWRFEDGA